MVNLKASQVEVWLIKGSSQFILQTLSVSLSPSLPPTLGSLFTLYSHL